MLNGLCRRIERYHPLWVVRGKEERVPGICFAVHVLIIGIVGTEVFYPQSFTVTYHLAAPEARRGIEEVLVVLRVTKQELFVLLVLQLMCNESCGIVVVSIFQSLGD